VGGRTANEDTFVVFSSAIPSAAAASKKEVTVAAVFDGHAGDAVSRLAADSFQGFFEEALKACSGDISAALKAAIAALDAAAFSAWQRDGVSSGSTLLVAVETETEVWLASVGDSEAVLCEGGKAVKPCARHGLDNADELARFAAAGVAVSADAIQGCDVTLTRALGNWHLGAPFKARGADGSSGLLAAGEGEGRISLRQQCRPPQRGMFADRDRQALSASPLLAPFLQSPRSPSSRRARAKSSWCWPPTACGTTAGPRTTPSWTPAASCAPPAAATPTPAPPRWSRASRTGRPTTSPWW
jgi:hypothetical protein